MISFRKVEKNYSENRKVILDKLSNKNIKMSEFILSKLICKYFVKRVYYNYNISNKTRYSSQIKRI